MLVSLYEIFCMRMVGGWHGKLVAAIVHGWCHAKAGLQPLADMACPSAICCACNVMYLRTVVMYALWCWTWHAGCTRRQSVHGGHCNMWSCSWGPKARTVLKHVYWAALAVTSPLKFKAFGAALRSALLLRQQA